MSFFGQMAGRLVHQSSVEDYLFALEFKIVKRKNVKFFEPAGCWTDHSTIGKHVRILCVILPPVQRSPSYVGTHRCVCVASCAPLRNRHIRPRGIRALHQSGNVSLLVAAFHDTLAAHVRDVRHKLFRMALPDGKKLMPSASITNLSLKQDFIFFVALPFFFHLCDFAVSSKLIQTWRTQVLHKPH